MKQPLVLKRYSLAYTCHVFKRNFQLNSAIYFQKNDEEANPNNDNKEEEEKMSHILKSMKISSKPILDLAKPIKNKILDKKKNEMTKSDFFKVNQPLTVATEEIVKNLPSEHKNKIKNILLTKLKEEIKITQARKATFDISEICAGMKIDQNHKTSQRIGKPDQKKFGNKQLEPNRDDKFNFKRDKNLETHLDGLLYTDDYSDPNLSSSGLYKYAELGELRQKIDLFGAPRLNIFHNIPNSKVTENEFTLWDKLEQKELQNYARQAPLNAFEEMIQMTKDGKIWKFPIDNESGLEEEGKIPFYDHVFLATYVEDRLGQLPPDHILNGAAIKHFMELVAIGLSKNPYYTVQEKRDTIQWYFQYFEKHESIIRASYQDVDNENTDTGPKTAHISL